MADEKLNVSPEEKAAGEKGSAKKDKAAKEKAPEPDKPPSQPRDKIELLTNPLTLKISWNTEPKSKRQALW